MTLPSLPAQGSTDWYPWATGVHSAAAAVPGKAVIADIGTSGTATGDAVKAAIDAEGAAKGWGSGGASVGSTEADFVISKSGSTITATPRSGSGFSTHTGTDAYTVIQAAINDLTPAGALGSGGGRIHIERGTYNLTNQLAIVGWEASQLNPVSQLIIEGDGHNTVLQQNTTGKHGLIVSNAASFGLRNLRINNGSAAKSCLRLDAGGTNECSSNRSFIDNVRFDSQSTTDPAGYFQNFFELSMPNASFVNPNNTALILENTSTTTNYGNSNFGLLRLYASATSPNAGMIVRTTNSAHVLDMVHIGYFYCTEGYYGLFTQGWQGSAISLVDIEYIKYPVWFDGGASLVDTRHVSILSGYLLPSSGGTAITQTVYTGGNNIRVYIETNGDSTVVPVVDQSQFRPVNSYDLTYPTPAGAVAITTPATALRTRLMDGSAPVEHSINSVTVVGTSAAPISSASTARPATSGVVYWLMAAGVTPTNAAAGDLIFNHS